MFIKKSIVNSKFVCNLYSIQVVSNVILLLYKINTVLNFLWILRYKERLETKYLKAPANKISLVGSCCRFVNMRLDDFSDCSSDLSRNQRGVSSVIFQRDTSNHNSSQKHIKGLSKEHTCFSKQMIQKQIRRDYVAAVEEKLKQHPLAMFPHYRDHMTPEVSGHKISLDYQPVCHDLSVFYFVLSRSVCVLFCPV